MAVRRDFAFVLAVLLISAACAQTNQRWREAFAQAEARQAARHEPQPIAVPDGMMETDVYARAGAPTFSTTTGDGGKILVYEVMTSHTSPSQIIDTTPRTPVCVSNCGNVMIIPPRQSSVVVPGETRTTKKVYTFNIAPDGHVRSITFAE